jgi:uncharacterized caspase-like protein
MTASMCRRSALALSALLLSACAAAPGSGAPARLALVIGNAAYEGVPALANPVNDANDMCVALRRVGFKTLCHTNLRDRAEFDARVGEYLAQLGPATAGVVYYSGHGVQAGNANYLIPTQVSLRAVGDDPLRTLYGVNELFARLRQKTAPFQLVILDACRTDLFAPAAPGAARSALVRSLEDSRVRAGYGLAPIQETPPNTMVLYATASREAAFDGIGRNGPLTKHVLAHLGTHAVKVQEFMALVTRGVETETARDYQQRQRPFVAGSFGGDFCFAGCPFTFVPLN